MYLRPSAAGSGLPELIGFLNGTFMRRIFNLKTFIAKFVSCFLSVGSGMPVGPEGPMIHLGSIIGAGLSQFQSKTLGVKLPYFERFRNPEDRRNFISAGAAAGIASAFGAPVGGLLFAMEEMSSFWSMELSWQVLFCSMISAFTTDLFNSSFQNFRYTGSFGLFKTNQYILFQIDSGIDLNIIGVVPAVMLGVLGGLLGSLFITLNLRLSRARLGLLSKMPTRRLEQLLQVGEPLAIVLVYTTVSVLLPAAFPCTPLPRAGASVELPDVESYTCPANTSYNQAATLFFLTGEKAIQHLFSRDTHLEFGYSALVAVLGLYFLFSCWSAGTNISSGLMVPMILIGALYGRLLGRACVDMFGVLQDGYWDWLDPGAFALLGAVSFMGGVTRLTMSLAVIMVEITNDIQFLILIIVTIMFAKWTGDIFTPSLYHALMEHKHIPYLPEHAPQLGGAGRGAPGDVRPRGDGAGHRAARHPRHAAPHHATRRLPRHQRGAAVCGAHHPAGADGDPLQGCQHTPAAGQQGGRGGGAQCRVLGYRGHARPLPGRPRPPPRRAGPGGEGGGRPPAEAGPLHQHERPRRARHLQPPADLHAGAGAGAAAPHRGGHPGQGPGRCYQGGSAEHRVEK